MIAAPASPAGRPLTAGAPALGSRSRSDLRHRGGAGRAGDRRAEAQPSGRGAHWFTSRMPTSV